MNTPTPLPSACPFLGLVQDPATRCDYASPRHQCRSRKGRGRWPTRTYQRSFCLNSRFPECGLYQDPESARPWWRFWERRGAATVQTPE